MIKRFVAIVITIAIIVAGNQITFANFHENLEPIIMEDIKIFINGNEFKANKPIYNFKSSTLIPMRAIFEELGAEINWIGSTGTVVANANDKVIKLSINNRDARINGQHLILSVEPKLIEGTTYVPLRFVAEALGYDVSWDSRYKIITIIDIDKNINNKRLKVYESSSNFKDDYIRIEIIDNEEIKVEGQSMFDKTSWMFVVQNVNNHIVLQEYKDINHNGSYGNTFNIKRKLNSGEYKLSIFFKSKDDDLYWSYYWNIPLIYKDNELFFPISPVYAENYLQYNRNSVIEPNEFLNITLQNEFEKQKIKALAKEIIKSANNDYDKLFKIHNWVAQNIFYDRDAYRTGQYGATDAYGTLESRKSVCQGYAELTNALLRSIGIPARIISGHALGVSADGKYWDEVNHNNTNHAWNEAFVNGRWVVLDTTWNSRNKYENGEYNKEEMIYKYFDPDLEVFSYTHKIIQLR